MKIIYTFLVVSISVLSCSQDYLNITKITTSSGSKSFPSVTYKSQKLYFKNNSLISVVNYSHNGWQVYDSIRYRKKNSEIIFDIYIPNYINNKVIKSYSLEKNNCRNNYDFSHKAFNSIGDMYGLSKIYLVDLDLLLKYKPTVNKNKYKFKECVIPSIFTNYGIPFNEPLSNFSFLINEKKLIITDSFDFEKHIIKRTYFYNIHNTLNKVKITIEDKELKFVNEYEEVFTLD